jgi:elongation factor G
MEADGHFQIIKAHTPEAELYRYSTSLRSMTHGRGTHSAAFSHYDAMPRHVQDALIAERTELEEA